MEKDDKLQLGKIVYRVLCIAIIVLITAITIWAVVTILSPIADDKKDVDVYGLNSEQIDRINEALNRIVKEHIDDQNVDKLIDGAISGIAEATDDPYTRYITDEEYEEMLISGTEQYGGIGVHISYDDENKGIIILGIMPNTPAQEAGLKVGDIILTVDDLVVTKETYSECTDKIKGEEGSTVKLTILRNSDEMLEKQIQRKTISVNNIESEMLEGNIGYIRIWAFENSIYKQFKTEYDKFNGNVNGLIIDLRNNSGGLVDETLKIADLLVPPGEILRLKYKDGTEKVYKASKSDEVQVPLVVLVNEHSASASEILAGIIKDTSKGKIVGTKTFGKGIVQTVEKLQGRGALAVTTSKYYTPSGVEIHKNGIEPNIFVELPEDQKNEITFDRQKDTQLKRAIEYINTGK